MRSSLFIGLTALFLAACGSSAVSNGPDASTETTSDAAISAASDASTSSIPPDASSIAPDASATPTCGDGMKEGLEACDDGANNGKPCFPEAGKSCTWCATDCRAVTVTAQSPACISPGDGAWSKKGSTYCESLGLVCRGFLYNNAGACMPLTSYCTGGCCDATAADEVGSSGAGQWDCGNTCAAGFQRSGTTCVDIDECAAGTAGCDANADCKNKPGGFDCLCKSGYTGDGKTCTALPMNPTCLKTTDADWRVHGEDYCARFNLVCAGGTTYATSDTCGGTGTPACTDARCCAYSFADEVGSPAGYSGLWTCSNTCPAGYTKSNGKCVDDDECTAKTDTCDRSTETCVNTPGSFSCQCKSGYTWNGTGCTAVSDPSKPFCITSRDSYWGTKGNDYCAAMSKTCAGLLHYGSSTTCGGTSSTFPSSACLYSAADEVGSGTSDSVLWTCQ